MVSCDLSDSGACPKENGIWREGLGMKRPQILEARAGVGHGVVDVNDKSIKEGTTKRCVSWGNPH